MTDKKKFVPEYVSGDSYKMDDGATVSLSGMIGALEHEKIKPDHKRRDNTIRLLQNRIKLIQPLETDRLKGLESGPADVVKDK